MQVSGVSHSSILAWYYASIRLRDVPSALAGGTFLQVRTPFGGAHRGAALIGADDSSDAIRRLLVDIMCIIGH